MIKNKTLKIITLAIILIIILGSNISYATDIDLSDSSYKPSINVVTGGSAMQIISNLLSTLTVLGVVSVVVVIALIGFNSILGSASEKADIQQKLVGVVIAVVMITSGSIIAQFIISFAVGI